MTARQSYPLFSPSYGAWEVTVKPAPLTRYKVCSLFSCSLSALPRQTVSLIHGVSALSAEVGKADHHVRLAFLAFDAQMPGRVREYAVNRVIAVRAVQLALGQPGALLKGNQQLFPFFLRQRLDGKLRRDIRLHGMPPPFARCPEMYSVTSCCSSSLYFRS